MENKGHLKRDLSSRQMQMIALGGTIGVGLFMGSSATIKWTGPSVLLAYGLAGLVLYIVMRALGEMLYVDPSTGSFAKYGTEYIHPLAGYLTAWSNVFQYLVVGISEVIAVGQYLNYWWPGLPGWISGSLIVITLCIANLVSVKAYGELEFWFALIKVVTIIFMLILGALVILLGFGNNWHPLGFSNLWSHGGFFTGGFKGFVFALSIVIASYQGIEVIGITAGEAKNPQVTVVKSIKSIVTRILLFYIGSIFVIVTIYPWNQLDQVGSPFVETFSRVGITAAASIINFVLVTAAMSGCNSGIFSSSRMLYTLGLKKEISDKFVKLSKHGVPTLPVITISAGIFLGMIINEFLPHFVKGSSNIFVLVYSSSVLPGMVPWFIILISQIRFRKAHAAKMADHPFKLPLYPLSNYFAIIALLFTLGFMFVNPETRISVIIGFIFLFIVSLIFLLTQRKRT
ncbi:amino acid permease [Liquorilactobacillus sucicola DSM 21376 = JCM 15457]|uniref:Amino acid transporter n=1 Tax=Liquorilactobacillus sucicola DSM 21376 = JCM 15457 TaxID=1423806 RepID=A0A023CXZ5_9LACO|nr:amino acid permease [Liquorilactobacillus sucicola]KRN06991.1 amino acid transporter [Liquorilactobacillus sucicola DSM 21376 = JCM 15457]GAJ26476.1 amino acid permease [Liquorilactobacillus sucicola DSM 21376 = JCM 15457]